MKKLILGLLLSSTAFASDYSCSDDYYTVVVRDNNSIVVTGLVNGKAIDLKVENAGYRRFFNEEFYGSTLGNDEVDYVKLEVTALLKGSLTLNRGTTPETRALTCEKL